MGYAKINNYPLYKGEGKATTLASALVVKRVRRKHIFILSNHKINHGKYDFFRTTNSKRKS